MTEVQVQFGDKNNWSNQLLYSHSAQLLGFNWYHASLCPVTTKWSQELTAQDCSIWSDINLLFFTLQFTLTSTPHVLLWDHMNLNTPRKKWICLWSFSWCQAKTIRPSLTSRDLWHCWNPEYGWSLGSIREDLHSSISVQLLNWFHLRIPQDYG